MQEKSNVKVNILWNTFGTILRIDSFEASGQLSLAMTTSSSFGAIAYFSMRNYQISDVDEKYKTMHYVGSRIVTCVVAFLLCTGYSLLLNFSWYQVCCVAFFMIVRVVEAAADVLHGINQKYDR